MMYMIRLLRRCHLPLLALLSFSQPLVLVLSRFDSVQSLSLFSMLCAPVLLLLAAVPGRMRPAAFGACLIALWGAAHWLLPAGALRIILPAVCAAMLLYALSFADKDPAQASPIFYFACVLAQLTALFLSRHADEAMQGITLIRSAFYLWLPLFLLAFNRISLNNATLARYRLSAGMARSGAVFTVCVYLIALLLCAMPIVVSGVVFVFGMLRAGSVRLLLFLINLFPTESTGGSMGGGMPMLFEGAAPVAEEPSLFAVVLEKIAAVFSVIILIAGCAILLRLLALALVRLMRSVLAHLRRYAAAVTEDYIDEITDTREESGERAFLPLRRRIKQKPAYPDTPAGRIRRRYALLLARHPAWSESSTARENLPDKAASLYERARYSGHAPTAKEAQQFEQETR